MKLKKSSNKFLTVILLVLAFSIALKAQNQLMYIEAQGVIGYRSDTDEVVYYSHHSDHVMQKPSIGFDWLKRFANDRRDIAVASVQFRLALNIEDKVSIEPQLYNAWLKYKSGLGDISAGHLKPASGLSYNLDNHALLLPDMTMFTLAYDRDWGVLYSKDIAWGNVSASLTSASGMLFYRKDNNYLAAGHISYGLLNDDNFSLGATLQQGKVLEAMGYHIGHNKIVHDEVLGGLDATIRYNNIESMIDIYAGQFYKKDTWSILWRNGLNLLPEDVLKLEAQGIWREFVGTKHSNYSVGITWKFHPDLAFRTFYDYHTMNNFQTKDNDYKIVAQIYYYKRLF